MFQNISYDVLYVNTIRKLWLNVPKRLKINGLATPNSHKFSAPDSLVIPPRRAARGHWPGVTGYFSRMANTRTFFFDRLRERIHCFQPERRARPQESCHGCVASLSRPHV